MFQFVCAGYQYQSKKFLRPEEEIVTKKAALRWSKESRIEGVILALALALAYYSQQVVEVVV